MKSEKMEPSFTIKIFSHNIYYPWGKQTNKLHIKWPSQNHQVAGNWTPLITVMPKHKTEL